MNTKYFFLLLVFLLVSSASFSVNTSKKSKYITSVIINPDVVIEPINIPNKDPKKSDPKDWEAKHQKTNSKQHHSEEDGKHHHIHFHRLTEKGKRRYLLLFIAKLVLIISHLSVLIFVFMHSMH